MKRKGSRNRFDANSDIRRLKRAREQECDAKELWMLYDDEFSEEPLNYSGLDRSFDSYVGMGE